MQQPQLVTLSERLFGRSALAMAGRVLIGDRMAARHVCREDAFWSISTYACPDALRLMYHATGTTIFTLLIHLLAVTTIRSSRAFRPLLPFYLAARLLL